MTQAELDREAASALGEVLCEIRRRGFSLANLDLRITTR